MAKNTGPMPNKSGSRQITGTVQREGSPKGGTSTGRPHAHGGQVPAGSVKHDGKMPPVKGNTSGGTMVDTDSMEARADRNEPAELRMAGRKESSVGTKEY